MITQAVGRTPIEVRFADEARVGRRNTITRRWVKRGTCPAEAKARRTASASIFGAICPARGAGAGPVMPRCTTEAMGRPLAEIAEIAEAVAPGAHAVLLLDLAGWHTTKKFAVPPDITLLPLPARAPELNPVENLRPFMRDSWLGNRIFTSYADMLELCCDAWNSLIHRPWRIMSIGLRDWAHGF